MKRTYVDANVMIAAWKGDDSTCRRAMEILDDPARVFVVSDYLRLEVIPKPTFHKRDDEVEFMQAFVENASEAVPSSQQLSEHAVALASKYDMTPIDALHISAAVMAAVDEFVTLEKKTKPLCRAKEVTVVSLYLEADQ